MLSFKDKKKIKEIVNLLKVSKGGSIILIACSGKRIQQLVEKEIKKAFEDKTVFHTIKIPRQSWSIHELLKDASPEKIYLIYNLPEIISYQLSLDSGKIPDCLSDLNIHRDIFTEGLIKGIFWLDENTISMQIPFMSPDFWSRRTITALFKSSEDELKTIKDKVRASGLKKQDEIIQEKEAILREYLDKRPDDTASINKLRNELAQSLYISGMYNEALNQYRKMLKESRKINDREGEANALGNIGIIYRDIGRLDKALKYYNQVLEIDKEIGYRQGEANALGNIGIIY